MHTHAQIHTYFKELACTMWGLASLKFLGQTSRLETLRQNLMLPSRGRVSSSSGKPQFFS